MVFFVLCSINSAQRERAKSPSASSVNLHLNKAETKQIDILLKFNTLLAFDD